MMGAPMPINLQAFGYLPAPFGADGMPMPMVPIPPVGMMPTQPVLLPMDGAQLQQLNVLPQQGIDLPLSVPIATSEESKGLYLYTYLYFVRNFFFTISVFRSCGTHA